MPSRVTSAEPLALRADIGTPLLPTPSSSPPRPGSARIASIPPTSVSGAKEDYDFVAGHQWSEEDRQVLQRPDAAGDHVQPDRADGGGDPRHPGALSKTVNQCQKEGELAGRVAAEPEDEAAWTVACSGSCRTEGSRSMETVPGPLSSARKPDASGQFPGIAVGNEPAFFDEGDKARP